MDALSQILDADFCITLQMFQDFLVFGIEHLCSTNLVDIFPILCQNVANFETISFAVRVRINATRRIPMKRIPDLFLAHPHAAGESYFEHMAFAFRFSGRLFRAACAAFVHGIIPDACETTASTTILAMGDELRARRAALAKGKAEAPGAPARA